MGGARAILAPPQDLGTSPTDLLRSGCSSNHHCRRYSSQVDPRGEEEEEHAHEQEEEGEVEEQGQGLGLGGVD